jgi:predicted ester cyclase
MNRTEKRWLIERMAELINARDLDRLEEIVHPDHVAHTAWGVIRGFADFCDFMRIRWLQPFPDASFEVLNVVADGDLAASRVRFTGTNSVGIGPDYLQPVPACANSMARWSLMGLPPTGRTVDVVGVHMSRFDDAGRQIEQWMGNDQMLVLQQLDLLPEPVMALAA